MRRESETLRPLAGHVQVPGSPPRPVTMTPLAQLADRVERLLLRHRELQRTNELLTRQLDAVSVERDQLRTRLNQARQRLDEVLTRMPSAEPAANAAAADTAPTTAAGAPPAAPALQGVGDEREAAR